MSEADPGGQPHGHGPHGPKTPLDWLMIGLVGLAFTVALVYAVRYHSSLP